MKVDVGVSSSGMEMMENYVASQKNRTEGRIVHLMNHFPFRIKCCHQLTVYGYTPHQQFRSVVISRALKLATLTAP